MGKSPIDLGQENFGSGHHAHTPRGPHDLTTYSGSPKCPLHDGMVRFPIQDGRHGETGSGHFDPQDMWPAI